MNKEIIEKIKNIGNLRSYISKKETNICFCARCLCPGKREINKEIIYKDVFGNDIAKESEIEENFCLFCGSRNIINIRIEEKYFSVTISIHKTKLRTYITENDMKKIKEQITKYKSYKRLLVFSIINTFYDTLVNGVSIHKLTNERKVVKMLNYVCSNEELKEILNFLKENSDKELFKVLLVEIIGGDINE